MEYAKKVAETPPADNTNTANTANTPPEGWRSPWHGAAIGGTFGGLLTTALGYLYGHRGRWLAYDALAGGLTGGSVGYAVDSHNNQRAEDKSVKLNKYSVQGRENQKEQERLRNEEKWNNLVVESKEIQKQGGLGSFWDNVWKFGFGKALANARKGNEFKNNHVEASSYTEAKDKMDEDKMKQAKVRLYSHMLNPFT